MPHQLKKLSTMTPFTKADIKNLKCFVKNNRKRKYYACKCTNNVIKSLVKALKFALKVRKKFPAKQRKQLAQVSPAVKHIISPSVSVKAKRKVLLDIGIRKILDPFMDALVAEIVEEN